MREARSRRARQPVRHSCLGTQEIEPGDVGVGWCSLYADIGAPGQFRKIMPGDQAHPFFPTKNQRHARLLRSFLLFYSFLCRAFLLVRASLSYLRRCFSRPRASERMERTLLMTRLQATGRERLKEVCQVKRRTRWDSLGLTERTRERPSLVFAAWKIPSPFSSRGWLGLNHDAPTHKGHVANALFIGSIESSLRGGLPADHFV